MSAHMDDQTPPPGCPAHGNGERVPLFGPEFAANPQAFYNHLRQYGPTGPVLLADGVEAELVTDYAAARNVLLDPDTFRRDSRRWRQLAAQQIPPDSPALPMMAHRPNALFSDGADHMRLRRAVTDSLDRVDTYRLSRFVEQVAAYLIDQFSRRGEADLVADYAQQLPLLVMQDLFGCPAEIGDRVVYGISGIFDGSDAEKANGVLTGALLELVALKRRAPGDDVTSWLTQHQAGLDDAEMVHQLVTLLAAGTEPTQNLIATGLLFLVSHEQADLLVDDVIDEVLWNQPPLANYAVHYPTHDVELHGNRLEAGCPVVISFAAANGDPKLADSRQTLSRRAHLAWGAGPHSCPAKDQAQLISTRAIEELVKRLGDVDLAVPADSLTWRQGPWHRALNTLPAHFTPVAPDERTATPTPSGSHTMHEPPNRQAQAAPQARSRWTAFLRWVTGTGTG